MGERCGRMPRRLRKVGVVPLVLAVALLVDGAAGLATSRAGAQKPSPGLVAHVARSQASALIRSAPPTARPLADASPTPRASRPLATRRVVGVPGTPCG